MKQSEFPLPASILSGQHLLFTLMDIIMNFDLWMQAKGYFDDDQSLYSRFVNRAQEISSSLINEFEQFTNFSVLEQVDECICMFLGRSVCLCRQWPG